MPSFADSIVIFIIALILFGPKKLPELARQLGKLMAEFRRASNDFRFQMEEELRISEQEERQKKAEAAGTPAVSEVYPTPTPELLELAKRGFPEMEEEEQAKAIAASGSVQMMPPSSGLPEEASHGGSHASSNAGTVATQDTTTSHPTEPDMAHG